jgi:hypothetical protein
MQRVILEVRGGPLLGAKRVLEPGHKLRVGRRERADLIVPDDHMSAPHFEIAWDGSACTVRDLKSKGGTLLSGEAVEKADLENGSWIRAGESDFMVFFEEATPPPMDFDEAFLEADDDDVPPADADWLRQNRDAEKAAVEAHKARAGAALAALRALDQRLYAVLDASRSDRIRTLLEESVEEYRSLYEGLEGEALGDVAPYLVSLPQGSRLLSRIVEEGWEKRWCTFFTCARPFKDVRQHLRRFLMVADADTRERFYFRYYDPQVFRTFIETATTRQREELFGPISAVYVEGEHGELLRLTSGVEVS